MLNVTNTSILRSALKNFGIFCSTKNRFSSALTKKSLYYFRNFLPITSTVFWYPWFRRSFHSILQTALCIFIHLPQKDVHPKSNYHKTLFKIRWTKIHFVIHFLSRKQFPHASSFISFGGHILNYRSGCVWLNIPSLKETYGNSQRRKQVFSICRVIPANHCEWFLERKIQTGMQLDGQKVIPPLMKLSDSIVLLNAMKNILLPFFLFFC